MSAAKAAPAAPTNDAAEGAPKKGKKKLVIVLAAVLLLAAGGGGGAWYWMKSEAAQEAAADEDGDGAGKVAKKADKAPPPVFMPLDMFTINLANRDAERFLQLGVTLEIDTAKTGDKLKAYMPAIRNNILMLVSQKTAADLQDAEGKQKLAREIKREALKPIGIEWLDDTAPADDDDEDDEADVKGKKDEKDKPAKKKKKKKKAPVLYPVTAVHFSNFIIQ